MAKEDQMDDNTNLDETANVDDNTNVGGEEEAIGESIPDETVVSPVDLPQMESSAQPGAAQQNKDMNLSMILDIPVDIHVELGQARMNIRNILNFSEGTVIELERVAGDPVDIVVNGKFIGKGEVIVVDENFGIRVTELVDPEKRIESF